MPENKDQFVDPVCGMPVTPDQHALTFQQMHFAFCSDQCRERFLANPHLYIGRPGHKAPVQEGQEVLKHRRLKLKEALTAEQARQVIENIQAMMGIKDIKISDRLITITYDLMQVTEIQIEKRLMETGTVLGHGLSERLQQAFVHYLEETELSSLEVTPGTGGHQH